MKITQRIKTGTWKGGSMRASKTGWYALYSSGGISQTHGKHTLEEIEKIINEK